MHAKTLVRVLIEEGVTPIGLEQLFDVTRGDGAGGQGSLAGELETRGPVALGKAKYAQTGTDALLWVLASAEQALDVSACCGADRGGILA